MRGITFALLLLPGKQEAWRRCIQEVQEIYHRDYEAFRQWLGVTKVGIWLTETPRESTMIVQIEAEAIETLLPKLVASNLPFARWVRQHVLELHGLDVTQPTRIATELVLECLAF